MSRAADHQLQGHGGRDLQEAGERTRLLCDRRRRGEALGNRRKSVTGIETAQLHKVNYC